MRTARLLLPLLVTAAVGAVGCKDAYDVVENPVETPPANPPATPTPTPWLTGHLTLVPDRLDFGPVSIGCRSVQEIRVHNDGLEPVRIFGVALSLGATSEFKVDDYITTLEPQDTLTVPVAYEPANVGSDGAALLVQSDDPHQEVATATLSGQDSRAGERLDTFTQPPGVPADFIWLLDTSGSMSDDIDKVIANFDTFMAQLADLDIDYQMGLLTTSLDDEGHFQGVYGPDALPWISSEMGDEGLELFLEQMRIQSRQPKQTDERGLDSLNLALSDENLAGIHNGFVRDGARLVVTAFSDENDHSTMTPAALAQRLRAVKPSGDVVFSAIVGIGDPANACHDEEGDRYIQLAGEFNGLVENVCSASYSGLMASLGDYGSAAEAVFPLNGTPEIAYGFDVAVEGELVDEAPAGTVDPVSGWIYEAERNAIVFGPESVPAAGARVDVTYVQAGVCE